MQNVYDFHKPHLASEYPEVDGPLTQTCYPGALEKSYDAFRLKDAKRLAKVAGQEVTKAHLGEVSLEDFDYVAFHSPYGKLVQKGFARLVSFASFLPLCEIARLIRITREQMYNDYLSNPTAAKFAAIDPALGVQPRSETLLSKDIEKAFVAASGADFKAKTLPTTLTSKKLGNMYTASLYGAFASLLDSTDSATLQGKRIGMFSYGSGLAASFFSIRVKGSTAEIQKQLNLQERLSKMQVRPCAEYVAALEVRSSALTLYLRDTHASGTRVSFERRRMWPLPTLLMER